MLARLLLIAMLLTGLAAPSHGGERSADIAGLVVSIWTPDGPPLAPRPLLVFSHGFHGCATQSRFLMQAFAAAGYLVVAPNHRDATCDGHFARLFSAPEGPFRRPDLWTDITYRDRANDIVYLLSALRRDPSYAASVDWNRIGLVGHSLGGYTVLGLGGGWPAWRLPGIRAVLALSPYTLPFVIRHDLSGMTTPVMYQGGTLDYGLTPSIEKAAGAYALSARPKYFVDIAGAGHLAWADVGRVETRPAITAYSVAFLDRYVKGTAPAPLLTQIAPGVARLAFDSELGVSAGSR